MRMMIYFKEPSTPMKDNTFLTNAGDIIDKTLDVAAMAISKKNQPL